MAGKKTVVEPATTELAVRSELDDLMLPASANMAGSDGLGSEDLSSNDVILPRLSLLQSMSKAVSEDVSGAAPGLWWLTPHNRPANKPGEPVRFVVVKIFPTQRKWTPLTEGGGLECEAPSGDLRATSTNGLKGARLSIDQQGSVQWEGGVPTDSCVECVFGLGAAATAAGRDPTRSPGNGWLPKIITVGDRQVKLEDVARGPKCTGGIDVLALVAVPSFTDEESGIDLPSELVPCFISFAKTSFPAGRSLAGMIKMSSREPAWAKIYNLNAKKVKNDKGTFFVAGVQMFAYAKAALVEKAHSLYEEAKNIRYSAPPSDDTIDASDVVGASSDREPSAPPSDDERAPGDNF